MIPEAGIDPGTERFGGEGCDPEALLAALFSSEQLHVRPLYAKEFGQELATGFVGRSLQGWSGQADGESAFPPPEDFTPRRAGLDADP